MIFGVSFVGIAHLGGPLVVGGCLGLFGGQLADGLSYFPGVCVRAYRFIGCLRLR